MSDLLFLDLETTSLDVKEAEIIEIAHKTKQGLWCDTFKPTKPIPFDVSGITNIDNDEVENRPVFDKDIFTFPYKNEVAVCHNADYDLEVLKKYGIEFENYICTYRVAWWFYPNLPNHKLGTLRAFFGIPPLNLHRAENDTELLAKIFFAIVKDKNISVEEAIEITQIADKEFYSVWQFGKYKGQKVNQTQSNYIQWVLQNIKNIHPKFKKNIEQYV